MDTKTRKICDTGGIPSTIQSIYKSNLMENKQEELAFDGNGVDLQLAPFEIVTLVIERR